MKMCLVCLSLLAGLTTLSEATAVSSASRHKNLLDTEQNGLQGGPSFTALITALRNVGQSVEEEDEAAKKALNEKKGSCKSTLADKKKEINAAKRARDQAKADLEEYKADSKETDEAIKNLKVDITSSNGELDKLQSKLSTIRGKFQDKRKNIEKELTAIEKTITKAQAKGASLSQFLPAIDNLGVSLVQTSEGMQGPNIKALKADRNKVQRNLDSERDSFTEEESKMLKLIETERKKLRDLQQDLEAKQPSLAETEEKISETHRKITAADRSIKRDTELRKAVGSQCDRWVENSKSQTKIRRDALTQIKMAVKLLQNMDGSFLLQKDLGNSTLQTYLKGAVSFLQTRSQVQFEGAPDLGLGLSDGSVTDAAASAPETSELQEGVDASFQEVNAADPFASVKKLIQGMISNLKAEDAKDGNQQKYCDEQYSKNRIDQQSRKNDLDLKLAEVRNHEHEIVKNKDSLSYYDAEISRLQQEIQKSQAEMAAMKDQVKSEIEDHNLAIRILDQSISALKTLCGLSSALLQTGTGMTHRGAQCGEVVEIIKDAKKKFKEQNRAANAAVQEMDTLTKKSVEDATSAKQSKESEKATTVSTLGSRKDSLMQAKEDVKAINGDIGSLKASKENLDQQCGPNVVSADDRIKRLQEEIEALKNALQVLEGEAIPALVQEWPQTPVNAQGPSALQRAADAIGLEQ
jgi:chromosome segregation ATPase